MKEPLLEETAEQQVETLQYAEKAYSDDKLWSKLVKFGKKAGSSVVYACLLLFYTLQKPEVPMKTKTIIIGALGYFILPLDLIPDFAAGIGFTDDLGALGVALIQVAMHIDDDIKVKARGKLQEWFGTSVDTSEIDQKIGM
ncbi:YkvA family protein [Peribacillus acanthi]|uniref:YkvA family protein n=1 Tax=Peribacillus acanthi TaxID=2171554 RepID=UPI000D3E66D8|nr:YkvA family protein [Peribacillus acanthi]